MPSGPLRQARRAARRPRGPSSDHCGENSNRLSENLLDNAPVYVREAEVAPAVSVRQFGVIEPEQIENGRVQIVRVNFVHRGPESELVGLPISTKTLIAMRPWKIAAMLCWADWHSTIPTPSPSDDRGQTG
jgi:hypothetical protein